MKYVIGIDYGTLSARALLVNAENGEVVRSHAIAYPHGVMPGDLASVDDYESALYALLEEVLPPSEERQDICGLCVDATALTLLPLNADGVPLAHLEAFKDRPHAQIKLWKRHAAQSQAEEALHLAQMRNEPFLRRTGGTISCEWTLPKIMETLDEDPEVYDNMDLALDLCDFLTFLLTGTLSRGCGSMCYKSLWSEDLGFPSEEYLNLLHPGLGQKYAHVMRGKVCAPGQPAGVLRPELCRRYNLPENIVVSAGILDGHTALAAMGALTPEDAALVIGTSTVLTLLSEDLQEPDGICGIAKDALFPGYYGIDSGQNCAGDLLDWFVHTCVPADYQQEAEKQGISIHTLLEKKISRPWENRIIAADWWNGSRNAPCDLTLPGSITGLSRTTRPEDLYLTLLQSIVCGTGSILDLGRKHGIHPRRILVSGGIALKNHLLMQEYANLLNLPVSVAPVPEGPALGAALFAAVAAGIYPDIQKACKNMGVHEFIDYLPDTEHRAEYEKLYLKNQAFRRAIIELKKNCPW